MIRAFLLSALLALPSMARAHEADLPADIDISQIEVPRNIDLFTFLRFTRVDHHVVFLKMTQDGAAHQIGAMTQALTLAAVTAGQLDPRTVGKLVFDMTKLPEASARTDRLAAEAARLTAERDSLSERIDGIRSGEIGATQEYADSIIAARDKADAVLALVIFWQANPMDGAGS